MAARRRASGEPAPVGSLATDRLLKFFTSPLTQCHRQKSRNTALKQPFSTHSHTSVSHKLLTVFTCSFTILRCRDAARRVKLESRLQAEEDVFRMSSRQTARKRLPDQPLGRPLSTTRGQVGRRSPAGPPTRRRRDTAAAPAECAALAAGAPGVHSGHARCPMRRRSGSLPEWYSPGSCSR